MYKKHEISQLFQYSGHSEETFDKKLGIFLNTCFGPSFMISNFSKLLYYRLFQSQKITENIRNRVKFPNLQLFAVNFKPFSERSLQIFL